MQISTGEDLVLSYELSLGLSVSAAALTQMEGPGCETFMVSLSQANADTPSGGAHVGRACATCNRRTQDAGACRMRTDDDKLQEFYTQVVKAITPLLTKP